MPTMAESPKAEKQLHELLSHSLVDLYVGPENTHWILHEKLLCARSRFFQRIFYSKGSSTSSYGLPDDDDEPFAAFVSWLYSGYVKPPGEEKDLTVLFDLYLMGEKWQAPQLVRAVLAAVRNFYATTDSYPRLRRVQYIYANTDEDSAMRRLLVHSVARMMALNESIPTHWDKALRKNGQLAVDLIKSIQSWRIDPQRVPDMRRQTEDKGTAVSDSISDSVADKRNEGAGPKDNADESKDKAGDDAVKQAEGLTNGVKDAGAKEKEQEQPQVNGVEDAATNGDKKPEEVKKELDDNLPNGVGLPDGLPAEDID